MFFLTLIFVTSFILTFITKQLAQKKMLIDLPNERSSHIIPTPRGGGIAIAIAWFSSITYLYCFNQIEATIFFALLSGILISCISFLDDIYTLKPLPRIIIQSISTILALYFIGGLKHIDFFGLSIENASLLNILAFIGVLWFTNLFNFIDGIDGYLSSGTLFIALSLFFFVNDNLLLVLIFSILGFLPWNWEKAKIFMGDIGSTLLGFTIAILIIHYNNVGSFSIFNSLILCSLFWFDATLTLLKRLKNKENIGEAHRKHAYQRIVQYGFSHQKTVIIATGINLILFFITFISTKFINYQILFLGLSTIILFAFYKIIEIKKPFQ